MSWRPAREVHVKTRAELEAAMRSAERIVVDGDASLAAYAALLAGGGGPSGGGPGDTGLPDAARLRPVSDLERAAHAPRTARAPRLWPWVAGAAVLTAGAGVALLREHFAAGAALPGQPGFATASSLSLLIWPALAVATLIFLFLVLRLATAETAHGPAGWRAEERRDGGRDGRLTMTRIHRRAA
jgi:hypothetical protein